MRLRTLLPILALTAAAPLVAHADEAAPAPAPADGANPAADPVVTRLLNAKSTMKWTYATANNMRYGHAEALVDAPADKVAKSAQDYAHYKEFHRKFAAARVVAKEGNTTDLYMRYPVRLGPVSIEFYEILRFNAPKPVGNAQVIEAFGVKGDMKQGHLVITVKPISPKLSLLTVDASLDLKVPAPQSMVDEEVRDGANDFVDGIRHRAQGWVGPVTSIEGKI